MSAVWPPVQTPAQEEALLALASDYALAHGLVLRPVAEAGAGPSTTTAIHAPYALFPTPFPRALFAQAQRLQPLYNALYAQVTVDAPFLEEVVGGAVAKVDEFQGKLYDVWRQVEAEGVKQVSPRWSANTADGSASRCIWGCSARTTLFMRPRGSRSRMPRSSRSSSTRSRRRLARSQPRLGTCTGASALIDGARADCVALGTSQKLERSPTCQN